MHAVDSASALSTENSHVSKWCLQILDQAVKLISSLVRANDRDDLDIALLLGQRSNIIPHSTLTRHLRYDGGMIGFFFVC